MKTSNTNTRFQVAAVFSCFFVPAAFAGSAGIASAVAGEELAVWSVMAATVASENAEHPYKAWYFRSDFSAANYVSIAMDDPDREEFCGLSADDSRAMIEQLKAVDAAPVVLEESTAEIAGFKLVHKKNSRLRYFAMSRVVFSPAIDRAWLSIELNGERGSLTRFDKIGGEWKRISRCGAWYMPSGSSAESPRLESRSLGLRAR